MRRYMFIITIISTSLAFGCFGPKSAKLRERDLQPLTTTAAPGETVRAWTARVHSELEIYLPSHCWNGLTTDELRDKDGKPIDVYRRFGLHPDQIDSLIGNLSGLMITSQAIPVSTQSFSPDEWRDYEYVELPAGDGLSLCGFLGRPTARPLDASYIVMTHGLFGRQASSTQTELAEALRAMGHHVFALDMRGHGLTDEKFPHCPPTFGVDEAADLLTVSRYLREARGAKRVGLLTFSITSYQALAAAWIDSDPTVRTDPSPLYHAQPAPSPSAEFNAGMLVISPALNLTDYADYMETPRKFMSSPVAASFQGRIGSRMRQRGVTPTHSMWGYAQYELTRSRWMQFYDDYPHLLTDLKRFIAFNDPTEGPRRLHNVRVPVLVLQAADDPVKGSAQAVANLFSQVDNPNCGVILIKSGGHSAFAPLSTTYYYSLINAFFNPDTCPQSTGWTSSLSFNSPCPQRGNTPDSLRAAAR